MLGSRSKLLGNSMSEIQKVKPQIVDGVEFYISEDGVVAGVSIAGLARLAGVTDGSMRNTLSASKGGAKWLNLPESGAFTPLLKSSNGAKIVNDETVQLVLEHYAYFSDHKNTTALDNHRKFFRIGFVHKVKEIVGFVEPSVVAFREAAIRQFILQSVPEKPSPHERRFQEDFYANLELTYGYHQNRNCYDCKRFINQFVYGWFPAEIRDRLKEVNPGNKNRHHQHLDPTWIRILNSHLEIVTHYLYLSETPDQFESRMRTVRKYVLSDLKQLKAN